MLGFISTITTGSIVTAAKFNEIQNQVYQIVGPSFYNYHGYVSQPVSTATTISISAWNNLLQDVNQCYVHQTNAVNSIRLPWDLSNTYSLSPLNPSQVNLITANDYNKMIVAANTVYANSSTVSLNQLGQTSHNSTSTRTTIWNANMTHTTNFTWDDSTDAESFFALGGYFRVHLDSAGGTNNTDDTLWRNLILACEANLVTAPYEFSLADWNNLNVGANKTVTPGSSSAESVQIVYTKTSSQQLNVQVKFITDGTRTISLNVFSTIYEYYSLGNTGPSPFGFPARVPGAETVLDLNGGQGFNQTIPRRSIQINPKSLSFSGYTSSTLAAQVLSITNTGNTVTNITTVTDTGNGLVSLSVTNWAGPFSISSGTTATISLSYTGNVAGVYPSAASISGNMDAGSTTLPTTVSLVYKPFDFTLSPDGAISTITQSLIYQQQLTINPINGIFSTYTANFISGLGGAVINSPSNFSFVSPQPLTGPVVQFNPYNTTQGTYTAYVRVTVNGVTHDTSVTYVDQIPQTQNLGAWASASGNNNSVVGMSYDIIGGQRYLTIGMGMGADGSTTLDNGGTSYINTSWLDYSGDNGYNTISDPAFQCALYRSTNPAYSSFANTYGVWISPDQGTSGPFGYTYTRSYKFTVPFTGNYIATFSADNNASFSINYVAVSNNVNNTFTGSSRYVIHCVAGTNTVTINMENDGGPGMVALLIQDNAQQNTYWSTLYPVRSSSPYNYWQEAYRIPIPADGTARTFYNGNYCVKDIGAVNGNRWSSYFGDANTASAGSMFSVTDDGSGNLTVTTLAVPRNTGDSYYDTSLAAYYYNSYYYIDTSVVTPRYSQLEDIQNGSQTHQFTGFSSSGAVTTTLVDYPGYQQQASGGGGGGNNWLPVLVAIVAIPIGKIICTKLYHLGKLPEDVYQADQAFGKQLAETNPDVYNGYIAWAQIVVDWMNGQGPNMIVVKQEYVKEWAIRWAEEIATPWAEHMAFLMGTRAQDNPTGKLLMSIGKPISKAVGVWQRVFGKSNKPAGFFKGAVLIGVFTLLRAVVAIGKIGKK
jgi:hypothetical protein